MVFQVVEHAESDLVFPEGSLCSGKMRIIVSVVVHCPYGKECHQELSNHHNNDMIDQEVDIEVDGCKKKKAHRDQFEYHVLTVTSVALLPGDFMDQKHVYRPVQNGSVPGHFR